MTDVIGDMADIAGYRGDGTASIRATYTRDANDGTQTVTSAWHDFPFKDGDLEMTDLDPGPAEVRVTMWLYRETWKVTVPDEDEPITFGTLINAYQEFPPAVVGQAQQARDAAQSAATSAEGYRDSAKGYRDDAQSAADDAQDTLDTTVSDAADSIRSEVEQYADDAKDARDAAKDYRDSAKAHRDDAKDYRDAASSSASNASISASDADDSASSASSSESNAKDYRDAAKGYRDSAEAHRDDAKDYRDAASSSASNASISASDADDSASSASQAASNASSSADDAATSAANAHDDASDASDSAYSAQAAQDDASHYRDQARDYRDQADSTARAFDIDITTSTLSPSLSATVDKSGTAPEFTFALGIPKGDKGDKGDHGDGLDIATRVDTYGDLPNTYGHNDDGTSVLVSADGQVYVWDGSSWPGEGEGLELQGVKGDDGLDVLSGSSDPTGDAPDGTLYVNTQACTLWKRGSSAWDKVATLRGEDGTDGTGITTGTGSPSGSPQDGSLYVDTDTGDLYEYDGSWSKTGNLQGPQGDPGTTQWSGISGKPTTFQPQTSTSDSSKAKPGDWKPGWSDVTSKPAAFPPSSHTHTGTEVSATLGVTTDDLNTILGLLWSLVEGQGDRITNLDASKVSARPDTWVPSASQISDATTTGRAVVTASSQSAARSAIGAGTSSLALGTTSSTAMAGNRIKKVNSLPGSPDANILYCIPE